MDNFTDLLKIYYSRLFPLDEYYKWLSYGDGISFQLREFSFTLDGDVYVRNQHFQDKDALSRELLKMVPIKIDIGAVFNVVPNRSIKLMKLEAMQRELVFDIDLTDYDEVRTCCSGADICNKCWKYMVVACKILDIGLREDFGFENILWVFSGRRGVHCWVCDLAARCLDSGQRGAIGDYFQLITGGAYTKKRVNLYNKIHPSVKRALEIINPIFVQLCVEEQNMLGTEEAMYNFLELLPDEESKKDVKQLFSKYTTSLQRWDAFTSYFNHQIQNSKKWRQNRNFLDEVMIQYCYPRLDINVTKGLNHLLKSPFCVHPKTGKISIPFNPKAADKFDPITVPTINKVIEEIDDYDKKDKDDMSDTPNLKRIKDYKKTSLNKSLHVFREFLHKLETTKNVDNIIF